MNIDQIREVERLTHVHSSMVSRCHREKDKQYSDYGGRGIYVCDEWHDFPTFALWAINNGSAKGLHIDRKNNDGPYAPENCRFVTPTVNMNNRRSNNPITAFGETKTIANWSRDSRCVVSQETLRRRVNNFGWIPEEALTIKNKKDRLSRVCSKGHPLTPDNMYQRGNGYTICKICAKEQAKATYQVLSIERIKRSK